jgi:chromosome partitioning protein
MAFSGVLLAANNVPGYMVTTSEFGGPAIHFAQNAGNTIHLLDHIRLLRYIAYVGGSRVRGEYAGAPASPPRPTEPECLMAAEEIVKRTARPPRHTRVLTVANGKGGVAKTTTALNLAFALADHKQQRVLLIDIDGQASTTRTLPPPLPPKVPKETPPPPDITFLSDYFRGERPLASLIRPTRFSNLFLIPAQLELQHLDSGGYARPHAELQFVEDVRSITPQDADGHALPPFDWIIIDTPPAQSFFTRAAIAAADHVLIPAFAETYAVLGLNAVLATIQTMGSLMGPVSQWKDKIIGCAVCRWKPTAVANGSLSELQTGLDAKAVRRLSTFIPLDERVDDALAKTAHGGIRSIFRLTNRLSPAAQAYDALTQEVLAHVNHTEASTNRV